MKNLKNSILALAWLAVMLSGKSASGQSEQPRTNSAESSRSSATRADSPAAKTDGSTFLDACNASAEELISLRRLAELLEGENGLLKERLESAKRTASLQNEMNETLRSEGDLLRSTVAAKNETIKSKDIVIASQDKLITDLKAKRNSPWRRLGDVLIGVAAGLVLR